MGDVITYWNRGAEDLFGWHRADAVGKIADELMGTTSTVALERARAKAAARRPI